MAVVEVRRSGVVKLPQEFIGISTDTKPTDCTAGSTFYETDTGNAYLYNGTEWVVV